MAIVSSKFTQISIVGSEGRCMKSCSLHAIESGCQELQIRLQNGPEWSKMASEAISEHRKFEKFSPKDTAPCCSKFAQISIVAPLMDEHGNLCKFGATMVQSVCTKVIFISKASYGIG